MDKNIGIHHEQKARLRIGKVMNELIPGIEFASRLNLGSSPSPAIPVRMPFGQGIKGITRYGSRTVRATISHAYYFANQTAPREFAEERLAKQRLKRGVDSPLLIPGKDRNGKIRRAVPVA